MINITLPDGAVRQYESGVSAFEIAKSISEGLARKIIAAQVNGEVWDISRPIQNDAELKLLTFNDNQGRTTFWHSSAHLMAEAVEDIFPGVKFWVGPAVENGFYYDMDLGDRKLAEEDLQVLEKKMNELAKQNNKFERKEIKKIAFGPKHLFLGKCFFAITNNCSSPSSHPERRFHFRYL